MVCINILSCLNSMNDDKKMSGVYSRVSYQGVIQK